ncbi:hypothetical protein [Lewinella sp. IMCC34191]|uniref:hypothetical protein n=1 Tax=Lewinella sp. IMCC34191 TaxID=2259172 RepID=UPI000E23C447|nr:hypothetical protein [Lewinella sp. IMCC34191]
MTYLDYLLTHSYADLPPGVKAEISGDDYRERQRLARRLLPPPALPRSLRDAYRQRTQHSAPGEHRRWWWVTAAGWLLVVVLGAGWIMNSAPKQQAFQPPSVQWRTDTLTQVVTDTVIQLRMRTHYAIDTVYIPASPPPPRRIVLVRDTVYLPRAPTYARQSATVNREALNLLVTSRGD